MDKSPSSIVADFLSAIVAQAEAASAESELKGAVVLDSAFQNIPLNVEVVKGFVVSNSEWDFAPGRGEMKVYDSLVIIGSYYRIPGSDKTNRAEIRDKNFRMMQAAVEKLYADQTLGGQICDLLILRATDGDKNTTADSFAVINQPIILNPTGARIDYTLGEAK